MSMSTLSSALMLMKIQDAVTRNYKHIHTYIQYSEKSDLHLTDHLKDSLNDSLNFH